MHRLPLVDVLLVTTWGSKVGIVATGLSDDVALFATQHLSHHTCEQHTTSVSTVRTVCLGPRCACYPSADQVKCWL